jgi:oligoribonuclease NrnB/cAMP/cGMP phosphodiesterase (DHH superfamily)
MKMKKLPYRVKIFSHTDLDGVGPVILSKLFFEHVDYELCNYGDIDSRFEKFMDEYFEGDKFNNADFYDFVIITDISIKPELAERFDRSVRMYSDPLGEKTTKKMLVDHHDVMWLNKYPWAKVETVNFMGIKTSATTMFYQELLGLKEIDMQEESKIAANSHTFAEQVRQWDTWEWKTNGYTKPHDLNVLLQLIGKDAFIERFSKNVSCEFTEIESPIVMSENERINTFYDKKCRELQKFKSNGYNIGVIYAEEHISLVGNIVCERNPDIDFIFIITPGRNTASLRTVKNIDLAAIARLYGGNGRGKTAGCPLDKGLFTATFDFKKITNGLQLPI